MKKSLISLLLVLIFTSCKEKEIMQFTSDKLLEYCENNLNYENELKENIIQVTGKVAWIDVPKDGWKLVLLNSKECVVCLETSNSDVENRLGNYVDCIIPDYLSKEMLGQEVEIQGTFDSYDSWNSGYVVTLKECKIIWGIK